MERNQIFVKTYIVTLIGPDHPGLVDSVSAAVEQQDGNWLESRLCHLGGQFAGIVRVELPAPKEAPLRQALAAIQGLKIELYSDEPGPAAGRLRTFEMALVGQDRPGIVQSITHALARHQVNVEDFNSTVESAPMGGGKLFRAKLLLSLEESADLRAVQEEVEKIAEDLMCDLKLESPTVPAC